MLFELAVLVGGCFLWRRHQKKKRLGRGAPGNYQTYNQPYDNNRGEYYGGYPQPPPYRESPGSKGGNAYDTGYADYRGDRSPYDVGNEIGGYGSGVGGDRRRGEKGGYGY
jgi:hypothetical protein